MMRELTIEEENAIDMLRLAWNALANLPQQHVDDLPEAKTHIHALQRIVFTRPSREDYTGTV